MVWGAVGFKNDAAKTDDHRKWAQDKFSADLDSALEENPDLEGFVFMTNVDLTPTMKEKLQKSAMAKGLTLVEIYDQELLRDRLDSAEGLLTRVQYLEIPMSPDEQTALVGRYGLQLQRAVTTVSWQNILSV